MTSGIVQMVVLVIIGLRNKENKKWSYGLKIMMDTLKLIIMKI